MEQGAPTEQYVSQELAIVPAVEACYWSTDAGKAEVDFLVPRGRGVVPIEVKASENLPFALARGDLAFEHPAVHDVAVVGVRDQVPNPPAFQYIRISHRRKP